MKTRTAALKRVDVERAVGLLELHQVERGEIAGGVVEEEIFRAGIGRVLPVGALAGVPAVDGVVELHAGIAANPGAFGDFAEEVLAPSSSRSGLPSRTVLVQHSLSSIAACMNSSLARTERFSFWYMIEP